MPRPISDATAAEWGLIAGSLHDRNPRGFWDETLAPNPGLVDRALDFAPPEMRELLESVGSRMQVALAGGAEFQITRSEVDAIVPIIQVVRMAASIPA